MFAEGSKVTDGVFFATIKALSQILHDEPQLEIPPNSGTATYGIMIAVIILCVPLKNIYLALTSSHLFKRNSQECEDCFKTLTAVMNVLFHTPSWVLDS